MMIIAAQSFTFVVISTFGFFKGQYVGHFLTTCRTILGPKLRHKI
jgi:hypothetical protein